jgi:FimV-like protein
MNKALILLTLFISVSQAKGVIGSPEVSVNSQGNYVIEIQITNLLLLNENDIKLSNFKSYEPLPDKSIEYTLFEDLESYKRFTIALPNDFTEDYFSFRLKIDNKSLKDIFIFLPQNNFRDRSPQQISFKLPAKKIYGQPQRYDMQEVLSDNSETEINDVSQNTGTSSLSLNEPSYQETKSELILGTISSRDIETIWGVARSVKGNYDASIYQVMWAFYLENPNAFIDENINLVRNDIDLTLPSRDLVQSTNNISAKEYIAFMPTLPRDSVLISGPKLTLTAPESSVLELGRTGNDLKESIDQNLSIPLTPDNNSNLSGLEMIKKNTSVIELGVNSDSNLPDNTSGSSRAFQLNDLIWVGILSLLIGFAIAFVLIRLNLKPSYTKAALEEDLLEDEKATFQSNLSISNDLETQELDLVRTYIDMGDWNNAEVILEKLITNSSDQSIKSIARSLLDKKK